MMKVRKWEMVIIVIGVILFCGMLLRLTVFSRSSFTNQKSPAEAPSGAVITSVAPENSEKKMSRPQPMPALGDYVKITITPESWEYQIVAAVEYERGVYGLRFMDTSGLSSQDGQWGYHPLKPGFVFKPVKLEIINLYFREEIQGISAPSTPSPLE